MKTDWPIWSVRFRFGGFHNFDEDGVLYIHAPTGERPTTIDMGEQSTAFLVTENTAAIGIQCDAVHGFE